MALVELPRRERDDPKGFTVWERISDFYYFHVDPLTPDVGREAYERNT